MSKQETDSLTLREYIAFLEIENPKEEENLIYADDWY